MQIFPSREKIFQSPAKEIKEKRLGFPWISLDFLFRIERFQRVAATPRAKKLFCGLLSVARPTSVGSGNKALYHSLLILGRKCRRILTDWMSHGLGHSIRFAQSPGEGTWRPPGIVRVS